MKLMEVKLQGPPAQALPGLSSALAQPCVFVRFLKLRYACILSMNEAPASLAHPNTNLYQLQALQNLELPLGAAITLAEAIAACQAPSLVDNVGKTPH